MVIRMNHSLYALLTNVQICLGTLIEFRPVQVVGIPLQAMQIQKGSLPRCLGVARCSGIDRGCKLENFRICVLKTLRNNLLKYVYIHCRNIQFNYPRWLYLGHSRTNYPWMSGCFECEYFRNVSCTLLFFFFLIIKSHGRLAICMPKCLLTMSDFSFPLWFSHISHTLPVRTFGLIIFALIPWLLPLLMAVFGIVFVVFVAK